MLRKTYLHSPFGCYPISSSFEDLTIHNKIFCFDKSQNIYSYLRTFSIHLNYTTGMKFNVVSERIVEAGLIVTWQNNFEFEPIPQKSREFLLISLLDVGMLSICAVLFLFAIFVRYAEQIIYRKAHSENEHVFWRWANMMIDGDVHFFPFSSRTHKCIYHKA